MDKELKAKWVAALRSGEYTQTRGVLYDGKCRGHCCLGVLNCVSTGKGGFEGAYPEEGGYIHANALLGDQTRVKLQRMNDGDVMRAIDGSSFAEIADYIEANL